MKNLLPITVYAPNLPQRPERRESILQQFAGRAEFELHVVPAIERKQPTWGLWQTFYQIVEKEKAKNSDYFIFCEDDHVFTDHYQRDFLLERIEEAQSLGAELLSGGMAVSRHPVQASKHLFWVDWFNGMQFTVIFRGLYDKILAARTTDGYTLDIMLSYLTKNKFVIYPYISIQKEFGYSDATDINNESGRVTRFFENAQATLDKLCKVRSFYAHVSRQTVESVLSMDVSTFSLPTYVIHMKDRIERMEHIKKQFEGRKEFDLHIVDACQETNGALGLWKSICKIVSAAKQADEELVIICEDDHTFEPTYDKTSFVHQLMLAHVMGAEMLNGGVGSIGNLVSLGNGLYWIDHFWCTQFIVIYQRAYDKILQASFGLRDVADERLCQILTSKMAICPFISSQAYFGYSDVTSSNDSDANILRHFDASKRIYRSYQYAEALLSGECMKGWHAPSVKSYLECESTHLLHLGCGENVLEGWLNTDIEPTYGAMFMDASQKFCLPDDSMDYVFAEHLIEPFSFSQIASMLTEAYRVMKPNGVIRLTFFSPEQVLSMMKADVIDKQASAYIKWALKKYTKANDIGMLSPSVDVFRSIAYATFTRRMAKFQSYDYALISELLKRCGFVNIRKCTISESRHAPLCHIEHYKHYIPQICYQFEVLTVEAEKQ